MWKYILKRIVWLVIIAVCVATLIFTVLYLVPGDPAKVAAGADATVEEIEVWRVYYGLDRPFFVQLVEYLYNTFIRFDLGESYFYRLPVITEFMNRLPRTFLLGILVIMVDAVLGIPLGITAALHRNSVLDQGLMLLSMFFISIPGFWLALLMISLFSTHLGWLPAFGVDSWKCWIMPVVASAIGGVAQNARLTRSASLETLRADFVSTAKAKGVARQSVIYKHMLPNAMIPIVNSLGSRLAGVISGTVIIETVFAFPGIGLYMTSALSHRDYPVVRACVLVMALFSSVVMVFIDLLYAKIDPRIKAQYTKQASNLFKRR
jgi:peptide/nickel transport system permease protein